MQPPQILNRKQFYTETLTYGSESNIAQVITPFPVFFCSRQQLSNPFSAWRISQHSRAGFPRSPGKKKEPLHPNSADRFYPLRLCQAKRTGKKMPSNAGPIGKSMILYYFHSISHSQNISFKFSFQQNTVRFKQFLTDNMSSSLHFFLHAMY